MVRDKTERLLTAPGQHKSHARLPMVTKGSQARGGGCRLNGGQLSCLFPEHPACVTKRPYSDCPDFGTLLGKTGTS